ncbi:MAG TPA: NADH-quinone oxidoreductase subunit K [Woeseiaceae bacterium]|nr:NADH-quinone oxidoreductase subunit K [Woeseiaceae bacterium]
MSGGLLFALGGIALFAIGISALVLRPHLLRKILALNVMASGVFLILVGGGSGVQGVDPVPQAMVITGIVVSVSATALGLALVLRIARMTGHASLPEDRNRAAAEAKAE